MMELAEADFESILGENDASVHRLRICPTDGGPVSGAMAVALCGHVKLFRGRRNDSTEACEKCESLLGSPDVPCWKGHLG